MSCPMSEYFQIEPRGSTTLPTVNVTGAEVSTMPAASDARATNVCVPNAALLHVAVKGRTADCPNFQSPMKNSTLVILPPAPPEAFAANDTLSPSLKFVAAIGLVMNTPRGRLATLTA